jgi:hypothetical protein
MKKMKTSLKLNIIIAIGGILAIISVALPFFINPSNTESINWQRSQVTLSAIGFIAIFYAFYSTTIQLRKSMAKPLIKVAFNDKGEQQATLTYENGNSRGLPALYLINEGNAISRYFQIDFIIPEDIGKQSRYVAITRNNGKYIIPNTNDGKYPLFVNKPHQDPNILLSPAIDFNKVYNSSKESFEIEYRIYGDWAETQEGKLKVIIKKQEALHVPTSG